MLKGLKVKKNSSVNKYSSSRNAKIVHRTCGILAAVNDFIPKDSGMKNAHSVVFHCKLYDNSASRRKICTHKAIENMVDLSKDELRLTTKVNPVLRFRKWE